MATRKFLVDIDLSKNELQNAVIQPLSSAPSSPVEGQIYYNTTDDTFYGYANGSWLDLGVQGGAGATNLAASPTSTTVVVTSDTGSDATILGASETDAGVMTAADKTKLNGIAEGAEPTNFTLVEGAGAVMEDDTSTVDMQFVIDEDDMVSNLDTKVPTQQSVKAYVDNRLQGLSWKQSVRVATAGNYDLSSELVDGVNVDDVLVSTGDRVLVKSQTDASENGIYIVPASGAASRSEDANTSAEIDSMVVFVEEGTANHDSSWVLTTDSPTLGTDNLVYAILNSGSYPFATTSQRGIVELALPSEAEAKLSGQLAVTPASLSSFARKYTGTIGDGSSTSIAVTHGLGTQWVTPQLFNASTNVQEECEVELTSSTQTTFKFVTAPTTDQYRVVITG